MNRAGSDGITREIADTIGIRPNKVGSIHRQRRAIMAGRRIRSVPEWSEIVGAQLAKLAQQHRPAFQPFVERR